MYLVDDIEITDDNFYDYIKSIYNGSDFDSDKIVLKRFIRGVKRYRGAGKNEINRLCNDLKVLTNVFEPYSFFKAVSIHLKGYIQWLYCIYDKVGMLPPLFEYNGNIYYTSSMFKKGKCKEC